MPVGLYKHAKDKSTAFKLPYRANDRNELKQLLESPTASLLAVKSLAGAFKESTYIRNQK